MLLGMWVCNGFRKIPSEEFLGPKNPSMDFFGGETELKDKARALSSV